MAEPQTLANSDAALASLLAVFPNQRLASQISFIVEIDRLKTVLRRTLLADGSRLENSAEHSWHLALLALTLAEHAQSPVDPSHVIRIVLVHDLVEIDAGDTFAYDTAGAIGKSDRERIAAERIFGLLPPDQNTEFRALWEEFEAQETPEARFAAALDRIMPMLHNYVTQGGSWREHGITSERVLERNSHTLAAGSPSLHELGMALVADAARRGYISSADRKQDS